MGLGFRGVAHATTPQWPFGPPVGNAPGTSVRTTLTSLGLHTLKARRSDDHDFHDLHVDGIRDALEAAYDAGHAAAGAGA